MPQSARQRRGGGSLNALEENKAAEHTENQ